MARLNHGLNNRLLRYLVTLTAANCPPPARIEIADPKCLPSRTSQYAQAMAPTYTKLYYVVQAMAIQLHHLQSRIIQRV